MGICCQALQQHDAATWDAFYQEHVRELYGFVFRLVRGDPSAAADVFQDTWLDAVGHIEQFDPTRGELRAWLFGIARRRIALHWRKRASAQAVPLTDQLDQAAAEADGAILPDEFVEQLEQAAVVRASLLALPPDSRQMVLDKYIEGLSLGQIVAKTGKSLKSVESHLSRAREQLRALLRWYVSSSKGGKTS